MFGTPFSHTPPAVLTARQIMSAGQARADRELNRIEAEAKRCGSMAMAYEAGTLRGLVRNLCAELAAYEPEDGAIEVEFNGHHLFVHLQSEQIQANGYDISRLLSKDDKAAILCIAEEKARELMIEEGQRGRDDADYQRYVERVA